MFSCNYHKQKFIKNLNTFFVLAIVFFHFSSRAQLIDCGGSQISKLSVKSFRNGEPIKQAQTSEEWKAATNSKTPAWCYFDNDVNSGILYNWFAVNDNRGLAPQGAYLLENKDFEDIATCDKREKLITNGIRYENGGYNYEPGKGSFWSKDSSKSFPGKSYKFASNNLSQLSIIEKGSGLYVLIKIEGSKVSFDLNSKQESNLSNANKTRLPQSVKIPISVEELTAINNSKSSSVEKINYCNDVISAIRAKSDLSEIEVSLLSACYGLKLFQLLPNLYEDPSISISEWEDVLWFLTLFQNSEMFSSNQSTEKGKVMRGMYLYWQICVRQKLNQQNPDFHRCVVKEYKLGNFPMGDSFYLECKSIVDKLDGVVQSKVNCDYKFTKPVLSITWVDNRHGCCNPTCNKLSKYYDASEENKIEAEIQYLKDALEAHFIETNATPEHKVEDRMRLGDYISKTYYANQPDLGFDLNKVIAMMNSYGSAIQGGFTSTISALNNETNTQTIQRLKSKSRKIYKYKVEKFCSSSCKEFCEYVDCDCRY